MVAALLSVIALGFCISSIFFVEDQSQKLSLMAGAFAIKCVQCIVMHNRYYDSLNAEREATNG